MPPLSRLDVLFGFLRVLLVVLIPPFLNALYNFASYLLLEPDLFSWNFIALQVLVAPLVPLVVLGIFTPLLASNAAGRRAQEAITSRADLKGLFVSLVGLYLFITSLGNALLSVENLLLYGGDIGIKSFTPAYLLPGHYRLNITFTHTSLPDTLLRFFLGFALAFGPAIRESWQARAVIIEQPE